MSVFAPSTVGIRSSQNFAVKLLDDSFEIRDTSYDIATANLSGATLNNPSAISVALYHGNAPHDQALDVDLRFNSGGTTSRIFYREVGVIPASTNFAGLFLGPYLGEAVGANANMKVRSVPLLAFYPAGASLVIAVRTTGGSVAPTEGELFVIVTGYY